MKLSVVLPCYNEETNIAAAVKDVASWMSRDGVEGEIIVVNDGSKDNSLNVLEGLKSTYPTMRIVNRPKNGGYGVAVRDGCDSAVMEWIAFMDSDLQFHAEDLMTLINARQGYSFVTGRRAHRADSPLRNIFGKILGGMNWIMLGVWVRDVNCGMKMFTKELWPKIRPEHGIEKLFNTEMFIRMKKQGIPWQTVNVPHFPRLSGTPTGGSVKVIIRMFRELMDLRRAYNGKQAI
jgi:glycosyltransferase involved in cell wall biosynthesis